MDEAELGRWADSKVEFDPGIFQHLQVSFPWREQLPAITCPILLVTGDPTAGAIINPQVAREAASLWQQREEGSKNRLKQAKDLTMVTLYASYIASRKRA